MLFFLGRQPEIGVSELESLLDSNLKKIAKTVYWADIDEYAATNLMPRLGSVIKIANELNIRSIKAPSYDLDSKLDSLFSPINGKLTVGLSFYGENLKPSLTKKIKSSIIKNLKKTHSLRLVPNDKLSLSSASVIHNKLIGSNPKKCELNLIRVDSDKQSFLVAKTIAIQDIKRYTYRDRYRPKRDTFNGMLPPKLAQTIINLASGRYKSGITEDKKTPVILDPFCGSGVILQEAGLMGYKTIGTDINPKMIDYTNENLKWLQETHQINVDYSLKLGDATNFNWQKEFNLRAIDIVASELYLGRPYSSPPKKDNLLENIANCNLIAKEFLKNIYHQLSSDSILCIAVPCWFIESNHAVNSKHLNLVNNLAQLGFKDLYHGKHLIYRRPNQIVGRELLVLRKQ